VGGDAAAVEFTIPVASSPGDTGPSPRRGGGARWAMTTGRVRWNANAWAGVIMWRLLVPPVTEPAPRAAYDGVLDDIAGDALPRLSSINIAALATSISAPSGLVRVLKEYTRR